MKKIAIVAGGGGFIGSHLLKRLKEEGYVTVGVDLKCPEYWPEFTYADEFFLTDLREPASWLRVINKLKRVDEIYQLAADMGGAGYIFTKENDARIMVNSSLINTNLCYTLINYPELIPGLKVFFSSSACVYPEHNQLSYDNPITEESSAVPANPDSVYGWEKLFSEFLYKSMLRNFNLQVKIARFHNVFGPYCSYDNGREKAPAAICRKVAELPPEGGEVEIWGDGHQTRSFLYIDEALEGVRRLMYSDFSGPINIGSEEMVSIRQLVNMVANIANKKVKIVSTPGPTGVKGRNSDNKLIREKLNWSPAQPLYNGLQKTYQWIEGVINEKKFQEGRFTSENS